MPLYESLNIPRACEVGNTIYKKLFYENADLNSSDKSLFADGISKITWLYCLKPEAINIQPYKDDIRDYPEIEVLEVEVTKDNKLKRIAEIIMRTIPYPMLLIFRLEDRVQLYVAHQRVNQNDRSKNTIEEFISTEWLSDDSSIFEMLDIMKMRFTSFYTLYIDIVDAISVYNVSSILPSNNTISGSEARQLSAELERIEHQIAGLRAKLKIETQFNRKIELNIEIKRLELLKKGLIGG